MASARHSRRISLIANPVWLTPGRQELAQRD
jgi:hypothetical protein